MPHGWIQWLGWLAIGGLGCSSPLSKAHSNQYFPDPARDESIALELFHDATNCQQPNAQMEEIPGGLAYRTSGCGQMRTWWVQSPEFQNKVFQRTLFEATDRGDAEQVYNMVMNPTGTPNEDKSLSLLNSALERSCQVDPRTKGPVMTALLLAGALGRCHQLLEELAAQLDPQQGRRFYYLHYEKRALAGQLGGFPRKSQCIESCQEDSWTSCHERNPGMVDCSLNAELCQRRCGQLQGRHWCRVEVGSALVERCWEDPQLCRSLPPIAGRSSQCRLVGF